MLNVFSALASAARALGAILAFDLVPCARQYFLVIAAANFPTSRGPISFATCIADDLTQPHCVRSS